ncbi:MAG: hypothetical protein JW797_12670, partial [Bradymonadales bacterium]|nr:hypothetical protein [Bradymonadales bacterium]
TTDFSYLAIKNNLLETLIKHPIRITWVVSLALSGRLLDSIGQSALISLTTRHPVDPLARFPNSI